MKTLPLLLIAASVIMPSLAQWEPDRHQPYDACSPTQVQQQPAATRLVWVQGDNRKLTPDFKGDAATGKLELRAWRGERCSASLAVQANGPAAQLRVRCSDLTQENASIPATATLIRYTKAHGTPTADVIGNETSCDNPAGVPRGIWLQIDVPQNAQPGTYHGLVTVSAQGCETVSQRVELLVAEDTLPTPDKWRIHLDLWQHPQAVARWHDVEPWSQEHFALLRPLMKRLADAGQKCITCTLLDEAWNGQTYDWFPGMVRWIRGKDGIMRYDYTVLDAWIAFMHDEIGIREQISCYTMIPWHLSVKFLDEATGHYDTINATPGTREYTALWGAFLRDFHQHMQARGWADKTCIAIDERPDAYVRAAMSLVKEYAPSFRIASAVDKPSALTREVYNISPVITHAGSALGDLLKTRKAEGKITTFYVCLHPKKPNTFTHSAPAEAEWLGYFAAANHLDGFLRWAYNSWNQNPFESTDFVHWPSGDCFLVYPGNRSSIRFERLRDGIEQYEKINQLRTRAAESPAAAQAIEQMDRQLAELFTAERSTGTTHAEEVQQAQGIVESAAQQLRRIKPCK